MVSRVIIRDDAMPPLNPSLLEMQENIKDLTGSVKAMHESIQPMVEVFDQKFIEKLVAIVGATDSVLFGKKLLAGTAAVVTSLAAIGGGIYWLVNYIRHGG